SIAMAEAYGPICRRTLALVGSVGVGGGAMVSLKGSTGPLVGARCYGCGCGQRHFVNAVKPGGANGCDSESLDNGNRAGDCPATYERARGAAAFAEHDGTLLLPARSRGCAQKSRTPRTQTRRNHCVANRSPKFDGACRATRY